MKVIVKREGGVVHLSTEPSDGGAMISMPPAVVGKLIAMLDKAAKHDGYDGWLQHVEGRWRTGEQFDLNNT